MLVALSGTRADPRPKSACSGIVAGAVKLVDPITMTVGHTTEEVRVYMLLSFCVDGTDVSLHEPAAEASRVRFCDNGKEPTRGGLYAAQELVRTVRAAATHLATG